MRVTIKDVAKLAQVSPSTVTRVIQNQSTISDKTKERVRKAMQDLDYHPNLNARSLVSSYSQVIGLILPDDSDTFYQNPFFPSVLRGISQVAAEHNYAIQLSTGKNEEQRLAALSQMVFGRRVDGLIFLYAKEDDPLVQMASQQQFPYVILGKSLAPFTPLVDNDNIQAGFDATEFFIKQGLLDIAFIGGNKKLFVTQDRYTGYKKAIEKYHIPLDSQKIAFANEFLEKEGYQFMKKLTQQKKNIQAVVTTDSLLAEGVCHYIKEKELAIQVLSFDSIDPKLDLAAYININTLELGRVSFETILNIIKDNKEGKQICYRQLIPHHIIPTK